MPKSLTPWLILALISPSAFGQSLLPAPSLGEAAPSAESKTQQAPVSASDPAPAAEPAPVNAANPPTASAAEAKPLPAEAPPLVAPKAQAPAPAKAISPAPLSPQDRLAAEWSFLQNVAADTTSGAAAAESLRAFIDDHPDAPGIQDAQALLASLYAKQGDHKAAMVALLHLLYEFPDSKLALRAQSDFLDMAGGKLSRKLRPAAGELVKPPQESDKADRLALMLERLVGGLGDALYEPAAREIRSFQVRFPDYPRSDRVQWTLAQLYEKDEKYPSAVLAYHQLLAVYPESGYRPKALSALGGVYNDDLKDYKKAIDAYQELVDKYPDDALVLPVLQATARLFADRLKQYELAAQVDERIIKTFPRTEGALKAFKDLAQLLRERLSKPDQAVAVYRRLAAQFGAPASVEALENAADISRRDLKNYKLEIELRSSIAADYPASEDAAEQLYDAGQVYEDDLNDVDDAVKTYRQAVEKFPKTKYGRKAEARALKLSKKP